MSTKILSVSTIHEPNLFTVYHSLKNIQKNKHRAGKEEVVYLPNQGSQVLVWTEKKNTEEIQPMICQEVRLSASHSIRKLNSLMQLLPRSLHHQILMLHKLTKGALELCKNLCMWNEQFVFFFRLTDYA